jgi:hypothetical protein
VPAATTTAADAANDTTAAVTTSSLRTAPDVSRTSINATDVTIVT